MFGALKSKYRLWVHVYMCWQRQAIGCHGSCDGDCADVRFETKECSVMGSCGARVLHSWSRLLAGSTVFV